MGVESIGAWGHSIRGEPFSDKIVSGILKNEVYVGDVLIGKTPSRNVISKKIDEDHVSRYVENHHEGIVDRELWKKVKEIFNEKDVDMQNGQRRERILSALREEPGLTKSGISARIGESLGQQLSWMKKKGLIRNEGRRWVLA